MDHQTKMITNGKAHRIEPNVVKSFSELARDVVELSELQTQLLMLDVKATSQRMRTAAVLAIVGVCVLLGSVPVALLIAAEALVEYADWPRTAALAVAAGIGLVVTAVILGIAWYRLKTMLSAFDRSREELSRNVAWLKSSLQRKPAVPTADRPLSAARAG
jgi:uncharacterized membrane protein YciS (DUF1049 family)